ncbi:MAG TPA: ammonium transporter, partial [Sulfurovum sp.]|nr:ammonium transporter [Sulfurovum sp.]
AWTLVGTVIVYYVASALTGGARVSEEEEATGLDESIHGEKELNL